MLVNREVFPIGRRIRISRAALRSSTSAIRRSPRASSHLGVRAACTASRSTAAMSTVRRRSTAISAMSSRSSISRTRQSPQEVGRWWMPGQWTAGGEKPTWEGTAHRCHHPMRVGNRLYTSYWHGGFVILNIDDITKPKFVSGLDWSPPFPWPTHTALPVPFPLRGRRVMLVADEDVVRLPGPTSPAFLWLVDITDETRPIPVRELPGRRGRRLAEAGLHRPAPVLRGHPQHRNSDRVVRARAARRRHRKSARAEGSRFVHAGHSRMAPSACKATTCASTTAA